MEEDEIPEEVEDSKKRLEKLHRRNVELENDLRTRGVGVNPAVLFQMRLDLLMNMILSEEDRYEYEIQSAQHVHDILMHIQQETMSQKLVTPPTAGQLIVPG